MGIRLQPTLPLHGSRHLRAAHDRHRPVEQNQAGRRTRSKALQSLGAVRSAIDFVSLAEDIDEDSATSSSSRPTRAVRCSWIEPSMSAGLVNAEPDAESVMRWLAIGRKLQEHRSHFPPHFLSHRKAGDFFAFGFGCTDAFEDRLGQRGRYPKLGIAGQSAQAEWHRGLRGLENDGKLSTVSAGHRARALRALSSIPGLGNAWQRNRALRKRFARADAMRSWCDRCPRSTWPEQWSTFPSLPAFSKRKVGACASRSRS